MRFGFLAAALIAAPVAATAATVNESFTGLLGSYAFDGTYDVIETPLSGFDRALGTLRRVEVTVEFGNPGPLHVMLDPRYSPGWTSIDFSYVTGFDGAFPFGKVFWVERDDKSFSVAPGDNLLDWSFGGSRQFVFEDPDVDLIAAGDGPVARWGGFEIGPDSRYGPYFYSADFGPGSYSIGIDYVYDPYHIAPIPLPPAVFPMVGALVGVYGLGRRKRARAAA